MRRMLLSRRLFVKVDDEMFNVLKKHTWTVDGKGYAIRILNEDEIAKNDDGHKHVRMHRFIFEHYNGPISDEMVVDHIDGDTLNNQISNLRLASVGENLMNKKKKEGGSSKYKGVDKFKGKWRARIAFNKNQIHVGMFDTEEEAARAYTKTKFLFKEFAKLNFPEEEEEEDGTKS